MSESNKPVANPFKAFIDLAAARLGAKVLYSNDDFFAEKENLIKPGRGIFITDKYTDRGKWMDGWESRRKRTPGFDFCIVKLATRGKIHGLDIDTNHFLGNHPPFASVEAADLSEEPSPFDLQTDNIEWTEILPKSNLNPGSQHYFDINPEQCWTHVKLNIYPDGGVARLKVYGEVQKDWTAVKPEKLVDLAAAINGAKALDCNDMFFSKMDNLIMPGRGVNMGDGWETKRNRTPNNRDWVIVELAMPGTIKQVLIDTCHFKGNYPDTCSIEGCYVGADESLEQQEWFPILPKLKLQADHEHYFQQEVMQHDLVSHVRLFIYPDGGVSRMRLFGKVAAKLVAEQTITNALSRCCGSTNWVAKMVAKAPFYNEEELISHAEQVWQNECKEQDWLEAFNHHPKIGDVKSLKAKFASTKEWAGNEQAGVNEASDEVIQALADGNSAYEAKFGYIFIVCATGKSAKEMLDILNARLPNSPEKEIQVAIGEQQKITEIRLRKLLNEDGGANILNQKV